MTTTKWSPDSSFSSPPPSADPSIDWRERLAAQQSQAIEQRKRELAEQSSESNTPAERIRIWERLHALPLPRESAHPLLGHIAKSTGLTVEQVHDEQRQRAAR
ncbi:MAG TPA: hypothetical protein VMU86_00700 [Steroidobacteraceae bacterium]|nr:hypothetical protein [Steroidobacteraceae bacterium]